MRRVANSLYEKFKLRRVAPRHCTSEIGFKLLREWFKENFDQTIGLPRTKPAAGCMVPQYKIIRRLAVMQGQESLVCLDDKRPDEARWAKPVIATVLAVVLIGLFAASYIYGSAARAEIERANAAAIDLESRTFCASLGLIPTSDNYKKCTLGLDDIRRHHQERRYADMEGLL